MTTDPSTSSHPPGSTTTTPNNPTSGMASALTPTADSSGNDTHDNSLSAAAAAADKPRLTEQEKKNNHIASEQKRRQAIREGFDELADIVPGLKGQGRSEAIVLQGATRHVKKLLAERWLLMEEGKRKAEGWGADLSKWEMDPETAEFARRAVEERENGGEMSDMEQLEDYVGG